MFLLETGRIVTLFPLAIAPVLDYLIGDPWGWPHPVQGMGWVIRHYQNLALKVCLSPFTQRLAGMGLGIGLVTLSGGLGWGIIAIAHQVHPMLGIALESILLAACFAGRSLRHAAEEVLQVLSTGDLVATRSHLAKYVGRDTETLTEPEILRAVLETVTENATDGVLAPLFYALLGAALGLGAVPLALGYKAASTLDSMVGYKEMPYTYLGWFSARMEDYLTWVPCRLVVLTLALLSGKPQQIWKLCQRDAPQDSSPNSGWSECAYAAVLNVQVGGKNSYRGIIKQKPLLGDPVEPITPEKIEMALGLTRRCFLLWLAIALPILILH